MLAMALPSPAGDGTVEATLVMTPGRCRVMPAKMLPSHTGDGTAGATWLWHDVDAESCWRQCRHIMLAMELPR
jgi:hypothetical protein